MPCLNFFISYDKTCILDKFSLDEIVSKYIIVHYVFNPLLACLLTSASQCQKIRTRAHTSNTFSASKLLFCCIKIKSALFYNLKTQGKAIETGIILSILEKTYKILCILKRTQLPLCYTRQQFKFVKGFRYEKLH